MSKIAFGGWAFHYCELLPQRIVAKLCTHADESSLHPSVPFLIMVRPIAWQYEHFDSRTDDSLSSYRDE